VTAILALIDNSEKMRKYLFWYLMIIPALLFLWIAVGAANSQMSFQDAMKIPFFTVAFMNGCLSLLLGGTLKLAGIENERTEHPWRDEEPKTDSSSQSQSQSQSQHFRSWDKQMRDNQATDIFDRFPNDDDKSEGKHR